MWREPINLSQSCHVRERASLASANETSASVPYLLLICFSLPCIAVPKRSDKSRRVARLPPSTVRHMPVVFPSLEGGSVQSSPLIEPSHSVRPGPLLSAKVPSNDQDHAWHGSMPCPSVRCPSHLPVGYADTQSSRPPVCACILTCWLRASDW